MLLISSLKTRYFEGAGFMFFLALICLISGFILYYPYLKGKKKPKSGVKRNSIFEYVNDAFKILSYHRSIGLILMGILFLIASIIFLIIGLFQ